METLREGIKERYRTYHLIDRDQFPELTYNTNRTNYEPLVKSFEEEFYVVRGIVRGSTTIHIPSTKTFASIFCDDTYVPGRKILDTCQSYADGKLRKAEVGQTGTPVDTQSGISAVRRKKNRLLALVTGLFLVGLVAYVAITQLRSTPSTNQLIVDYPTHHAVVPRRFLASGRVKNAHEMWLVAHVDNTPDYYVQREISIRPDGSWKGLVHIGRVGNTDIGLHMQVRVFVNPIEPLEAGEVLYTWPKAEFASQVIDVIRGPKDR